METELAPGETRMSDGRHSGGASVSPAAPEKAASTSADKAPKPRSCVVCRRRKVRCDKQSPCSNCRRADIPCVLPSTDRPPRWARRLERNNLAAAAAQTLDETSAKTADPAVGQVMDRLKTLESLVKDLSGQLEQAHAAAHSSTGGSPASSTAHDHEGASPSSAPSTTGVQSQFGRLVVKDQGRSRYVSTGFWSRVNDVLDEIKTETRNLTGGDDESTDDEYDDDRIPGSSPSTLEMDRTPSERHAFLFRHNLMNSPGNEPQDLHPLPSQIPFLLDIFSENVNQIVQIVHMPTVRKIVRPSRDRTAPQLTPVNEALLFAIYYAAVTSMEEEDVMSNFGAPKTELNLRYRLGLEQALAKADFLTVPDLGLLQAFAIFLFLVRRHDSPRFVWMMTGLAIRMGQALGLQRDASHFQNFTPYEVQMRRRVWYCLCMLDVRASEDQGTDFSIPLGSFDTKLPLNINDADIDVDTTETPPEREGMTDMTLSQTTMDLSNISRQMMLPGVGLEEQDRLLGTIYEKLEKNFVQYSAGMEDLAVWILVSSTRVMAGKLTLLTHLPILFSSPGDILSDQIKNKLLVAAIEVAEFNHALNAERACRHWRWIFQTYTHWHAIVYLLIDISSRPWSPIAERSWLALHSPWLIPSQRNLDKSLRIWIPLRKLMSKARRHREAELERLRGDPWAAQRLEEEDRKLPLPATMGPESAEASADVFRKRWREVIAASGSSAKEPSIQQTSLGNTSAMINTPSSHQTFYTPPDNLNTGTTHDSFQPVSAPAQAQVQSYHPGQNNMVFYDPQLDSVASHSEPPFPQNQENADWNSGHIGNPGLLNWFWADPDSDHDPGASMNRGTDAGDGGTLDMDVDFNEMVDWNTWVESAKGLEMANLQATSSGAGR